jgi:NAD(P)-dependent dehydrogenase (short-subunit alcohol dehydrogenase family)
MQPTAPESKTLVITGATSGIGLAVAELAFRSGVSVIGVGRSEDRCRIANERVSASNSRGARIEFLRADLSLQADVRRLAGDIGSLLDSWDQGHLDALINNAATVPFWQTLTPEGFDLQWAVNHLAPFLLTGAVLGKLRRAPLARVVTVSSGSHYGARLSWDDLQSRRHYNPLRVYKITKLANVLFTAEFNRHWAGNSNIRAFAADPGLVNTELGLKSNSFLARSIWDVRRRGGVRPEEAARGIAFLAMEPSIQNANEIYWRNGKPKSPNPYALNPQAARQLWAISSEMCGCRY